MIKYICKLQCILKWWVSLCISKELWCHMTELGEQNLNKNVLNTLVKFKYRLETIRIQKQKHV